MKTLSNKMILSSTPTIVKFTDKKGKIIRVPARKCGQKMYLQKDVKKFIKDLKKRIYEDDYLGYKNKMTLKHYNKIIDELAGTQFHGKVKV